MSESLSTLSVTSTPEPSLLEDAKRSFLIVLTLQIFFSVARLALILTLTLLLAYAGIKPFLESGSFQQMQKVISLWQKQVIIDFRVTNTLNCPQNYEEYTQDAWPGNIEGCACSTQLGLWSYQVVFRGRCSPTEFQAGCLSVPANGQIPYAFWRQSMHLCVLRLKNFNFYSDRLKIETVTLQQQKKCGEGQGYQIDVVDLIQCPVTTVESHEGGGYPIGGLGLWYQRSDDYPIVDFIIFSERHCPDQAGSTVISSETNYVLLNGDQKTSCHGSNTVFIDSQSQQQLLRNNPKILQTIEHLPEYPPPNSHLLYRLGYRRYPPWSYGCRKSSDYDLRTATDYLSLSQYLNFQRKMGIILFVILGFQILYMAYEWISLYFYYQQKHKQGYLYLKDDRIRKLNPRSNVTKDEAVELFKFFLIQTVAAITLIVSTVFYSKLAKNKNWYSQASNCTSEAISSSLSDYSREFGNISVKLITFIIVLIVLIALDIGHLLWRRWKGDLAKEDSESQVQKDVSDLFSSYKPGYLGQSQVEMTEECLVANTEVYEKDLKGIYGEEKDVPNSLFDFEEQDSEYSENASDKVD